MKNTLKTAFTAVLLSTVAAAPIATALTVISADAAFAKGGNDKGNKGGNDRGNKSDKGNKGKSNAQKGNKGGGKDATRSSSQGGGNPFKGLVDRVKGNSGKASKGTARKTTSAPKTSVAAAARPEKVHKNGMHPSELGNMNGALNSSPNAMAAHIRNGNYNGPVGHMALLAVAKSDFDDAKVVLDQQAEFDALGQALFDAGYLEEGYSSEDYASALDAYYADRREIAGIDPIDAIETPESDQALREALVEAGYLSDVDNIDGVEQALADYDADKQPISGIDQNDGIDGAVSDLGGDASNPEDPVAIADVAPSDDELMAAKDAETGLGEAERKILDYWNKNPGVDSLEELEDTASEGDASVDGADEGSSYTESEEELLGLLHDKVAANESLIDDALANTKDPEADGDEAGDDDLVDCDDDAAEGCGDDDGDGDLVLITD